MIAFADGPRAGGDGHRIIVGIRPEHVVMGDGLAVVVELAEPLGSETVLHGRLDDGSALLIRAPGGPPREEKLAVSFPPAHLHVFDQASGKRLDPIRG